MDKLDSMNDVQFVFGAVLVVANRMDTLLERELKEFGITAKQWFMSVVMDNLFLEPPTIKELAREMGSSHQNVKQVALKLEQKGLLTLKKDPRDARATRLHLTDQSRRFWDRTEEKGIAYTKALFKGIDPKDLSAARRALKQMIMNLSAMEQRPSVLGEKNNEEF